MLIIDEVCEDMYLKLHEDLRTAFFEIRAVLDISGKSTF